MSEVDVIYILDEWKIYPDKSQIIREQETVHLEPKIMEVLVYLLQNANRVISRDELTENVWQSKYASDEVITRAISVLRKKLGDTGKVHRFIKTIPKHGYVLEYETEKINDEEHLPPLKLEDKTAPTALYGLISPKTALSVALCIAVVSTLIVIWVLTAKSNTPFKTQKISSKQITVKVQGIVAIDNLPSSNMVARVLSEELITILSNSEFAEVNLNGNGQEVKQRTQSQVIATPNQYIISGGVKEIENEYFVNVHFTDGDNGNVLWSQSFAGDKETWHKLVNNISKTIDYFITVASKEKLDLKNLSLKDLQASIIIYQAKELRLEGTNKNLVQSKNMLENALATYPDNIQIEYELALSILVQQHHFSNSLELQLVKTLIDKVSTNQDMEGEYLFLKAFYGFKSNTLSLNQSIKNLEKANDILAENIELLALLGDLYRLNAQAKQAKSILKRALTIAPNYSLALYNLAKLHSQQSQHQQAILMIRTYLTNNATHLPLSHLISQIYIGTGQFDQAINFLNKLTVSEKSPILYHYLAQTYFSLFYPIEAQEYLKQISINSSPTIEYQRQCALLTVQYQYQEASGVCEQADQGAQLEQPSFFLAKNLLIQGKYKQALQQYEHSFNQVTKDINELPVNYLLTEKVDYIWLLSKNYQYRMAKNYSVPILTYLKSANRLGYKGYGIKDVILQLASGNKKAAGETFQKALDAGWLHWFDIEYNGVHPALKELKSDNNFERWQRFIEHNLNAQREQIINKPSNKLPVFIDGV